MHIELAKAPLGTSDILSPPAIAFVGELAKKFKPEHDQLLKKRKEFQQQVNDGDLPNFLPRTRRIRDEPWTAATIPESLLERKVEITGPVDRKMIINALNSGAKVFMADFEDSHAPTWYGTVDGQQNLKEAVAGTIEYPTEKKHYKLNEKTAMLMVRPRGLHLFEPHMTVDGEEVPASLFDFGLFIYHNVDALLAKGALPCFYLPKLEHHEEAVWWNSVFDYTEVRLGVQPGTIKASVLIETLPATFEMDEIISALHDHIVALNAGRWDEVFSYIKTLREHQEFVLPDRSAVTMDKPFLSNYASLLVKTCHRRGILAMGGMAAQIPIKGDEEANGVALQKVIADKVREAHLGHDGTWVAHPGLVQLAYDAFNTRMGKNQVHCRPMGRAEQEHLLAVPAGEITEEGVRHNVRVGIQYLEAWLGGTGCVPLYGLMEDAATAEICRTQLWQWQRHGAKTSDGKHITPERVDTIIAQELEQLHISIGPEYAERNFEEAKTIFREVTRGDFVDFLTIPAYEALRRKEHDT